ncbi:MAG: flippase [Candidatus Dormibacteraceae bacterium]
MKVGLGAVQESVEGRKLAAPSSGGLGRRALRNTALVLSARVISRLIALVTVIKTAHHLAPGGFGQYQTLVNYTALVAILVDLGFNTLYVREGARAPHELERYLNNVMSSKAILAVLGLIVLAGALRIPGLGYLFWPGFVLMVLTMYSTLLRGTFYALQQLRVEAIAIVLESVILLLLVLAGIRAGAGVAYFLWAYAASYGFSCLYFMVVITRRRLVRIGWHLELDFVARWFWTGLPFALTFAITTLYFKIDVPILQHLRSYQEVGWYGFAYKPFEALLFVPQSMMNVIFPVMSVYYRDSPRSLHLAVGKFYKALALIGWPITVGTVVLAAGLSGLLQLYPQSEPALRILGVGIFFMFVNNAFIALLTSIDRQWLFTGAALGSLVVNLVLNFALIPPFGYLGAAWATVVTELALGAFGWYLVRRVLVAVPVWRLSWRILLAGLIMGAVIYWLRGLHGWAVLVPVAVGMVAYGGALHVLRAIDPDEVELARRALGRGA